MRPYCITVISEDIATCTELTKCNSDGIVIRTVTRSGLITCMPCAANDAILASPEFLASADLTAAIRSAAERMMIPVIALCKNFNDTAIQNALALAPFAVLRTPFSEQEMFVTLCLAIQRFDEFRVLQRSLAEVQEALRDRKTIERAKGIVMKQQRLAEGEAFLQLQRLARNHRLKMAEVASKIIAADSALHSTIIDGAVFDAARQSPDCELQS
jgi:AmiR/NasT family two-component response regulator